MGEFFSQGEQFPVSRVPAFRTVCRTWAYGGEAWAPRRNERFAGFAAMVRYGGGGAK